jgi:hypothetical protein
MSGRDSGSKTMGSERQYTGNTEEWKPFCEVKNGSYLISGTLKSAFMD